MAAVRIAEPIVIDGVLDEAAWALAEPAVDFYQQFPDEFAPATERSEVRFLYDDDMLYIGAMLYDGEPDRLIIDSLRRDFSNFQSDSFLLVFDTFLDRRNGYGFITNAAGAQRDVQASDNGRRNDANWDGAWFVRSKVTRERLEHRDRGALQDAPLSAGRRAGVGAQHAAHHPPQERVRHLVAGASPVFALRGRLRRPADRHHAASRAAATCGSRRSRPGSSRTGRAGTRAWDGDGDAGVDLKWGVTSSLLLDASYRTDFSQVEADEQQINLTRFSLFFPEKRQFFLESPASFQVGLGAVEAQRRDLVPFFSRRIGLSASGQPIPVIGGLRLTGRAAGNGIGLLIDADRRVRRPAGRQLHGRARETGPHEHGRRRRLLLRPRDDRQPELQQGRRRRSAARAQAGAGDRSVRHAKRDRRRSGRLGRTHQLPARYQRASGAHGPRPHRRRVPSRSRVCPPARHRHALRRL